MLSVTNNSTNKTYRYNLVIDNLKELSKFLNENPEMKNLNTFIDKANFQIKTKLEAIYYKNKTLRLIAGGLFVTYFLFPFFVQIFNQNTKYAIISSPITKLLILFVTNLYHVI